MNRLVAWFAPAASMILVAALVPCGAFAQQEVVSTPEEVVVVGTRRQGRTAVETAVPVDVFNRQDIDSVSSDDMLDIIRTLVPSFEVQRFPINDGATFVRPPTLRGMSADKILVLVNGKRRHRSALVQLSGDGVHGPDLATIPSSGDDSEYCLEIRRSPARWRIRDVRFGCHSRCLQFQSQGFSRRW
jgi:iron complex outermembrane receptor protein